MYTIPALKRVNFEYWRGIFWHVSRYQTSAILPIIVFTRQSDLQLAVQLRGINIETCRIQLDRESYLIVDIYVWHPDNLVTRKFCSYMYNCIYCNSILKVPYF